MEKKKAEEKFTVRFTVKSSSNDSLSGMIQTEDQDESEKRVLLEQLRRGGSRAGCWAVHLRVGRQDDANSAPSLQHQGGTRPGGRRSRRAAQTPDRTSNTGGNSPASEIPCRLRAKIPVRARDGRRRGPEVVRGSVYFFQEKADPKAASTAPKLNGGVSAGWRSDDGFQVYVFIGTTFRLFALD